MGVLLRGIVRNAAPGPADEFRAFVGRMDAIAAGIEQEPRADQLLIAAGSAVEALSIWQARAAHLAGERTSELESIIVLLAQTVAGLAPPGAAIEAVETGVFQNLREQIQSAASPALLAEFRQRMAQSLGKLSSAIAEHRTALESAAQQTDPASGLPVRAVAEDAIRAALLVPGRKYLVTVVLDRLQAINNRFSKDIGDLVLRELSLHLRKYMTSSDRLFRWTGPAITGIVFREESIVQMRAVIKRVFDQPIEKEFDIGGRRIAILITSVWSVVGLIPPATNIYNYVDRFVSTTRSQELI